MQSLESSTDNEIRLSYKVDVPDQQTRIVSITLIFHPGTRQLASIDVTGIEDMNVDVTEIIDAHIPSNDATGAIAAILGRVRRGQ